MLRSVRAKETMVGETQTRDQPSACESSRSNLLTNANESYETIYTEHNHHRININGVEEGIHEALVCD